MKRDILEKYFNDKCSEEELEEVLNWFQTKEGQLYLENSIDRDWSDALNSTTSTKSKIPTDSLYQRIRRSRQGPKQHHWFAGRVAAILLVAGLLSLIMVWAGGYLVHKQPSKISYITYRTPADQQKVITLSGGSTIRLNENSSIKVPTVFTSRVRKVFLKGEAYFQIVHDATHPFIVEANGAIIKDLGTKFNVRVDTTAGSVQVAVTEGKVMLKKAGEKHKTRAVLTQDHFGVLRLINGQIMIEKGAVKNYLSWMTNKLVFKGLPLRQVTRQLEYLYGVNIHFKTKELKQIKLTASLNRYSLQTVLAIIADALGIQIKEEQNRFIWIR